MIIRLSDSFDGLGEPALCALHAVFENLLVAHLQGHHVFIPTRRVIGWLREENHNFSMRQRTCIAEIEENYSAYSGLAKDAFFVVLAIPEGLPLVPERSNEKIRISITKFRNAAVLQPSQILVENAHNDGGFYKSLCDCLANEIGLGRSYDFIVVHGGGGTIAEEYKRLASSGRPLFCIVESDKCSPGCPIGVTAAAFRGINPNTLGPLNQFCVLNTREAENYIPVEILEHIFEDNPGVLASIQRIKRFAIHDAVCTADHEFIRWFDFKRGIQRSEIKREIAETCRSFLLAMWQVIDPGETDFDVDNYDAQQEVICGGVSGRILEQFTEHMKRPAHRERTRALLKASRFWREVRDLAAMIQAFAIAAEPTRT